MFNFVRGVDALIWTVVLARAFELAQLTATRAILITDRGTFGKIFSKALETVDQKQSDGVDSTGAKPLQRDRVGVIPQAVPVLLAQILYSLVSITRSGARLDSGIDCLANVSRTLLGGAVEIFPSLAVLNVTAQPHSLATRLTARGRESAVQIEKRLADAEKPLPSGRNAITVSNDGPLDQTIVRAVARLQPANV